MLRLPLHRIIPFSNVEGIGNRTSLFVQGCNMNCIYCHNSETIQMKSDDMFYLTVDEIVEQVKANMPFIRGITVSGGEATIYSKVLVELFYEIHKLGLTCYIDTNGFFDIKKTSELIDITDKFLYDIKADENTIYDLCFDKALGKLVDKRFNFHNLEYLLKLNKVEEVRLVYLSNYFNDDKLIEDIANLIVPYENVLFKLIRVHTRGLPKERIDKIKKNIPTISQIKSIENLAKEKGIKNIVTIM